MRHIITASSRTITIDDEDILGCRVFERKTCEVSGYGTVEPNSTRRYIILEITYASSSCCSRTREDEFRFLCEEDAISAYNQVNRIISKPR
jgi:hypothetical protein